MITVGHSQLKMSHKRESEARTTKGFFHRSHSRVVIAVRSVLIIKNGQIIQLKWVHIPFLWLTAVQPSGAHYLAG